MPTASRYGRGRRSAKCPTAGCNTDEVICIVNVISPIWAKLRPYAPFSIGYSAGTNDWIMSLRKCEKLSARMIEKVAASAVRGLTLSGSETLLVIGAPRDPAPPTINLERQILALLTGCVWRWQLFRAGGRGARPGC